MNIFLYLYFFLIPFIPYSPIKFGKLMPSDISSLLLIFFTLIVLLLNPRKTKLEFNLTYLLLFFYVAIGLISSFFSPFDLSFIDFLKEPFLLLSSISAVLALKINLYKTKILAFSIHFSFLIILFFGLLGYLMFYVGINNSFISPSNIINVALPFLQNFELPPRSVSLIKPTSNLLAIYLTLYFPIYIYNYEFNISKIFPKNNFSKNTYLFSVFLAPIIALFTYSRAFIPLILILFFLPNIFTNNIKYFKKYFLSLSAFTFIILFMIIQFFTVFYTTNTNFTISNTFADSNTNKEIVNLGEGKRLRPNPVYFDDKELGKKTINFQTDLHFNHYFWLKRSAISINHLSWKTQLLGFGPSSFSKYIKSNYVNIDNSIKEGLKDYVGTQSQLFTTLITHGKIGIIILFLLILNFLIRINSLKSFQENPKISNLKLYIFISLILISLDCDVVNIRFIWSLIPYIYFINKSFMDINNKKSKNDLNLI